MLKPKRQLPAASCADTRAGDDESGSDGQHHHADAWQHFRDVEGVRIRAPVVGDATINPKS